MNSLHITRRFKRLRIEIIAERSSRLDLWVMVCRVNGVLYETKHSDDAWKDAGAWLNEVVSSAEDAVC